MDELVWRRSEMWMFSAEQFEVGEQEVCFALLDFCCCSLVLILAKNTSPTVLKKQLWYYKHKQVIGENKDF